MKHEHHTAAPKPTQLLSGTYSWFIFPDSPALGYEKLTVEGGLITGYEVMSYGQFKQHTPAAVARNQSELLGLLLHHTVKGRVIFTAAASTLSAVSA